MAKIVLTETLWARARFDTVTQTYFSTVAGTAVTSHRVLLVFLAFKWHWSSIILPTFTFYMMQ